MKILLDPLKLDDTEILNFYEENFRDLLIAFGGGYFYITLRGETIISEGDFRQGMCLAAALKKEKDLSKRLHLVK